MIIYNYNYYNSDTVLRGNEETMKCIKKEVQYFFSNLYWLVVILNI